MSLAAAGTTLSPLLSGCRGALLGEEDLEAGLRRDALDGKPRFLITIAAAGGASIIDSLLAVRASEAGANAARLNTFPDASVQAVSGSPFRAVRYSGARLGAIPVAVNADQLAFVTKYKDDLLVATSTGTSVNHVIAQKRALTGNGAWKGRTLQEAVALQWGQGFPLPNVNMAVGGYGERGADGSLPASCYAETVTGPSLWPLGLDGSKGVAGAPSRSVVEAARLARNELDDGSVFGRTFANSEALTRWRAQRADGAKLEVQDLITKLNVIPDMPPQIPLSQFGLATSPDGARLRQVFPQFFTDPFETQAALAFLLLKNRVSVAVTIGPDFNVNIGGPTGLNNPPLAFDYSHNDHRGAQAYMWARIFSIVDRLATLLKAEPFDGTESLWDRTLLYVATDFGRTRNRPDNVMEFGTGHDLNNGFVMLSPMVKGNTVLGGVDPATTMTYGFDPRTGQAQPGKTSSNEPDIYSGVLTAMGADLSGSGLPDASAFKG